MPRSKYRYNNSTPLQGNISIKYLDQEIYKSPRFDNVENRYIEYGGYNEVNNLIIAKGTVDFNKLIEQTNCTRDNTQRNLISGLVQNEDIDSITYNSDNKIYTVTLNQAIDQNYLAIELLFNLNQWGNTITYKEVDINGNNANTDAYSFNLLNKRINASLFDESISYQHLALNITYH